MPDDGPFKPGETAPASGQYEIIDRHGNLTGRERTVVKGEPMPPTPNSGETYRLVDRTKNKAGGIEDYDRSWEYERELQREEDRLLREMEREDRERAHERERKKKSGS